MLQRGRQTPHHLIYILKYKRLAMRCVLPDEGGGVNYALKCKYKPGYNYITIEGHTCQHWVLKITHLTLAQASSTWCPFRQTNI